MAELPTHCGICKDPLILAPGRIYMTLCSKCEKRVMVNNHKMGTATKIEKKAKDAKKWTLG